MEVFTGDERPAASPSPSDLRRPTGAAAVGERIGDRTRDGSNAIPTTRDLSRRPGWGRW
ncbi:hypothetical protein [Natrinema sp. SYSU A 869]|uniref:hypothetical protein n=1 Tax=Natrinema sp. SYSU A 869 TaxID=2871694 RepID=UPI001CA3B08F|nr:hypothetical protein [Natrinema sp. SYSU A 869]